MKATTVFLARISNGKGKFPFVPVQILKNRAIAPTGATGTYYARFSGTRKDGSWGRVVKPLVGSNIEIAYAEFLNLKHNQERSRAGQAPTPLAVEYSIPAEETPIKTAIEEYLASCRAVGNDVDTLASKTRTLNSFQDVCFASGVFTINSLKDAKTGRKALLAYLSWMKDSLSTTSENGTRSENTRHTRMRRLGAFLKQYDIKIKKDFRPAPNDPGLLAHNEFPKYKPRKATKFGESTIQAWLKNATIDEADLIHFFLATGFRDEEVAYMEWNDINFRERTINVHSKPKTASRQWAWEPKDDESRSEDIPLSDEFVKRMEARQQRRLTQQKCALIFPSGVCKPDTNLLRIVRKAAKRAAITEPIKLHKFRKTFASRIAKDYGIELARKLLGHSDIATTQGYLAADDDDIQKMREGINRQSAA